MKVKFAIIISNTERSIFYLKALKKNHLLPEKIIYLNDKSKNIYSKLLKKNNFFFPEITVKKFETNQISNLVAKFLISLKIKYIIYSGYPGKIIKVKNLLRLKKLLHSHPGKLPEYKGSTSIYYSILKEKRIFCSTLILNNKIDDGKVMCIKEYSTPNDIYNIDTCYDSKIRAENMIFVIKNLKKLKSINKIKKNSNTYYVIHPVLRSLVLNKIL
tara:strand:+ start:127 stop:771 length:645 start_codon:yes stop_codon:yes gene_type:complete